MANQTDKVRYARRFVIQHPDRGDIHGIQFPSGSVIYDQPGVGISAATSIDIPRADTADDAVVHWADEDT